MSNEYKDWAADNIQELKYNEELVNLTKVYALVSYHLSRHKPIENIYDSVGQLYLSCLENDIEIATNTNLLNSADINMYHLYMVIYLQDFICNMKSTGYFSDSAIDNFLEPFPSEVVDALWKIQGEFKNYNKLYYAFEIVTMIQTIKSRIAHTDIEKIDDISIGIGAIKQYHKHLFQEEQ